MNSILVWFRTDLRTFDNPSVFKALEAAVKDRLPVIALYVLSPSDFTRHKVSAVKIDFILRNLKTLSDKLWTDFKVPLIIESIEKPREVDAVLLRLVSTYGVKKLYFSNEYEVHETKRDLRIEEQLQTRERGVLVFRSDDQVVVPPGLLKSASGNPYSVYSFFKKSWFELVRNRKDLYLNVHDPEKFKQAYLALQTSFHADALKLKPSQVPDSVSGFELDTEKKQYMKKSYPAGEPVAFEKLKNFAEKRIKNYKVDRDIPSIDGTSSLSPYLASGVLSAKYCVVKAMEANHGHLDTGNLGAVTWIQEIIWRDFYKSILFCFPRVCKDKPFKMETINVPWLFDEAQFKAWKEGKTGYPIVDAGMRQLNATGWMHNRLRMIVASFLTKHLLISWQHGEEYFSLNLIDHDFASNNGGWQWAASTGTDSQPYFRVFNPLLQSQKYDPEGKFIRKWVPELEKVPKKFIHDPSAMPKSEFAKLKYPARIVEHESSRKRAIDAFASLKAPKEDAASESKSDDSDMPPIGNKKRKIQK